MWAALLQKELRENRWKWLTFFGALSAIAVVAQVAYGPMRLFLTEIGGGSPLVEAFRAQLDDPFLYHWGNWYAKNLVQLTTLFSLLMGMSAIAGEVSRGTAAFLFTRPIGRQGILSAKMAAGYGSLAAVMIAATLLLMGVAWIGGASLPGRFLVGLPMALLGGLILYLVALIASVLIDDPVKAGAAAAGLMLAMAVPGWIRGWGAYSVFRQMASIPLLIGEGFPLLPAAVMAVAVVVLYGAAVMLVHQKEFSR